MIFETGPQLSSDLEWMLQSGQASSSLLAEALIREYYPQVARLGQALLGDPAVAGAAALEAFSVATLRLHRYRHRDGARLWFFRIAVDVFAGALRKTRARRFLAFCLPLSRSRTDSRTSTTTNLGDAILWRSFDALPWNQRLPLLLSNLLDWQVSEIARLLQIPENLARSRLAKAHRSLLPAYVQSRPVERGLRLKQFDERLKLSFLERWPLQELPAAVLEQIAAEVVRRAQHRSALNRQLTSTKEIGLIGVAILLVMGLLWRTNGWQNEVHSTQTSTPQAVATRPPQSTAIGIENGPIPASPKALVYFPQRGDTLASVAARLSMQVETLASLNHLSVDDPLRPGQGLLVIPEPIHNLAPTPTPVRPLPLPPPLTELSGPKDVFLRMFLSSSFWRTFWADAQVIRFGPQGYVGPPLAYRSQVWVSQPGQSIELVGPLSGKPRYISLTTQGRTYYLSQDPDELSFTDSEGLIKFSELGSLVFPGRSDFLDQEGTLRVASSASAAGRPALLVDWLDKQGDRVWRLWIDAQVGVVLRSQQFGGQGYQTLLADTIITSINFDVDFPPALFDPFKGWEGGFAQDYRGQPLSFDVSPAVSLSSPARGHEPLPVRPAPAGFDPARSPLTLQFLGDALPPEYPNGESPSVHLFAGNYFLGNLEFVEPWDILCDRSPDGRRIAFASTPAWQKFPIGWKPPKLHWFYLSAPERVYQLSRDIDVYDFAFAPDSRRLAFIGGGRAYNSEALYILDTTTGDITHILDLAYARSLVWKPSGDYLALVGSETSRYDLEAIVLHPATGEILFQTPVNFQRNLAPVGSLPPGWPPPNWPVQEWGVNFPPTIRYLDRCIQPPGRIP